MVDVEAISAYSCLELGFGLLGGRKVIITADDYSIRAGHADGAISDKTVCILPVVSHCLAMMYLFDNLYVSY